MTNAEIKEKIAAIRTSKSVPENLKPKMIAAWEAKLTAQPEEKKAKAEGKKSKGGLENFDISKLDALERKTYDHLIKESSKAEALQILINNVEGNISELSPGLRKYAKATSGKKAKASEKKALALKIKELYKKVLAAEKNEAKTGKPDEDSDAHDEEETLIFYTLAKMGIYDNEEDRAGADYLLKANASERVAFAYEKLTGKKLNANPNRTYLGKKERGSNGKFAKNSESNTYKGRKLSDLDEKDCEDLLADIKARRQAAAQSSEKSRSKPVIEKVAGNVSQAVKHVIDNIPAEDIKDDPKGMISKMTKAAELARKFLSDLRALLGEDYDREAVDEEIKEIKAMIAALRKKYDQ